MHRIILTRRARADLDRLHDFIAKQSPRSARRAVQRIIEGVDLLLLFPRSGVVVEGDTRTLTIKFGRSGYVVRYQIAGDDIIITRIWHGKENHPR
ncbi:MAG: type II toxin-antitoxin system RelE/ParE family toxin [Proteobacteria bacterium]|nr:type II toxin-antitoxin system RelE/ParE family toxin [Pseudomonadota bacterium]